MTARRRRFRAACAIEEQPILAAQPILTANDTPLPAITIVIEWENAIDVEDDWARGAMSALQDELERVRPRMPSPPRVAYLFDERAVSPSTIATVIDEVAPGLRRLAELELVPTPGLTYYKLKNYGVARSKTELTVMLDSDAAPKPGWLENIVAPFADPEIMAVGGFTVLGHEDLLSRTMALSWIFDLPSERGRTAMRNKIHANNCAVRTAFFQANPFPDLPAFKKQCGFWLRDITARGAKWTRTADAMTVHAPHPGFKFIAWRAWTAGLDRDFQTFHTVAQSRAGRIGHAFRFLASKLARAWSRILMKGGEVGLPLWQRPAAMAIALGYFGLSFAAQLKSAVFRRFAPMRAPSPGMAARQA
jgi:hypothetical protein